MSAARAVVPAKSRAATVKLADPIADGVPEMMPAADIDRPAGSEPDAIDHVKGAFPPVADTVPE